MKLIYLIASLLAVNANPNPIWPKPAQFTAGNVTVTLNRDFQIVAKANSARLIRALERTKNQVLETTYVSPVPFYNQKLENAGRDQLSVLNVNVQNLDDKLVEKVDESYSLRIESIGNNKYAAHIDANTIYGAIHGLSSFTQLVQFSKKHEARYITNTPLRIDDAPKFPHRGIIFDSSRNYFSIKAIKRTIEAMALNKLNVFHWHIVDSHSWPFKSERHPLLWQKGAYGEDYLYTKAEIKDLIQFAQDRAVRIIPEVEAPAHSYAIGLAYPEIATCMDDNEWDLTAAEPPSGQIDPTNPKSIQIVKDVISEFAEVFTDQYFHLSGDEVNYNCWNSSEKIRNYIKENKLTLPQLLDGFANQMAKHTQDLGKKIMVWQEIVLNHNVTSLPKDVLVQVWIGAEDVKKAVSKGYRVIASSYQYWYFDCGRGAWLGDSPSGSSWCDPIKAWQMVYTYDLLKNLTPQEAKLVEGGEVALWSEQIDEYNLDRVAWPRASAASEVLWSGNRNSNGTVVRTKDVLPRLHHMRYRLVHQLGVQADAMQPLWCARNPYRCDSTTSLASWREPYVPKA